MLSDFDRDWLDTYPRHFFLGTQEDYVSPASFVVYWNLR